MHICHTSGCTACQWRREITPCSKRMTALYDDGPEQQRTIDALSREHYCVHCDARHTVVKDDLATPCSHRYHRSRPLYNCKKGVDHVMCTYHHTVFRRQVCCGCLAEPTYQGQVSSHQTGNHPNQISAGGNVVNVNYYGQNYAAANNPTMQSISPESIGSAATGLSNAIMPFVNAPTVEALAGDMSDRLMQMVSGNSCLITQESAAGAVIGWGVLPSYITPQGNTVDLPTKPGPACDRFYTLDTIDMQTNTTIVVPFPGCLQNIGVMGANLSFHYLWRAGAMWHVQFNTTPFHAGAAIVAVVPEMMWQKNSGDEHGYDAHDFFRVAYKHGVGTPAYVGEAVSTPDMPNPRIPVGQLTIYPHQIINFRTNNSATIVVPYTNFVNASCSLTHNVHRLVVVPLADFRAPTGTSQQVQCTITVAPLCSQFNGLRMGVNPAHEGVPVREIPGSSQFMTTLPLDGNPAYFNWTETPEFPLAGEFENLLAVARIPTFVRVDDQFGFEVANKLGTEEVWHMDLSLLSRGVASSYLGRFVRLFAHYKGSLVVNFTYTGSKFSTGKLLVAYTPPGGAKPNSREEAMKGTHVIWDFGLQSTLQFVVPYISASIMRFANQTGNMLSYDGYLQVFYQTSVVFPPNSPTTADVLVSVAAGEDFTVRGPMDTASYQGVGDQISQAVEQSLNSAVQTATNALVHVPTTLELTSASQSTTGAAPATSALETGATRVVGPGTTMETETAPVVGYVDSSIRSLLSRYWFFRTIPINNGTGSTNLNLFRDRYFQNRAMLNTLLSSFTYMRCDLDIVVLPIRKADRDYHIMYQVMYTPPGGQTGGTAALSDKKWQGMNPSSITTEPGMVNMRIPYTAPTSYIGMYYDGFPNFSPNSNTDDYGDVGFTSFGTLSVRLLSNVSATNAGVVDFAVFVRPVNIKTFIPRPLVISKASDETYSFSRTRLEVGDPENFGRRPDEKPSYAVQEADDGLPICYPEGPDTPGTWYNNEFYRDVTVITGQNETTATSPYFIQAAVYDPMYSGCHRAWHLLRYSQLVSWLAPNRAVEIFDSIFLTVVADCILVNDLLDMLQRTREYANRRDIDHFPDEGYESDVRYEGPIKFIQDTLSGAISQSLQQAVDKVQLRTADRAAQWWKTALGLVTKFISMVVLVIRTEFDPVTLSAVGAILTVDILNSCPFEWARKEIAQLLGIASHEGPMEAVKDMNAVFNMCKSLEWLVKKLTELVNWIKDKVMPKMEDLSEAADDVEALPTLMKEWREYKINPNTYTLESANQLARRILKIRDKLESEDPNSPILRYGQHTFTSVMQHLSNGKERDAEPVGVLIHGSPGTGKSMASNLLGNSLARFFGDVEPYSLPPDPKYFDGYVGQNVVIMDDLGQNPDGEDMKMICQMISSVQFHVPMADLADKGRKFTSTVVIATTNQDKLAPPTVSTPTALRRRFVFDMDIVPFPSYMDGDHLDAKKALCPCDHQSLTFTGCCPMICGKAVQFKDRRTGEMLSLDKLNMKIRSLRREKKDVADMMSPYYQGPVLKRAVKQNKPLPKELEDLIRQEMEWGGSSVNAVAGSSGDQYVGPPSRPMLQYAIDLGYSIPDGLLCEAVVTETRVVANRWRNTALIAGGLLALLTTTLLIWKLMPAKQEGPYNAGTVTRLNRPQPRKVEVQGGPDPATEFAASLMKHNLFPITTSAGEFTALGLFGKTFILPVHAAKGPYFVAGKEIKVEAEVELVTSGRTTELCVLTSSDLQDFRDVRKFLCDSFTTETDVVLAINSDKFPRMVVPIRRVTGRGMMNISGNITSNTLMYTTQTRPGYCGGILVKAGKIVGMHIAGDGVNGYSAWLKGSYFRMASYQGVKTDIGPAPRSVNTNRKTRFEPSIYHHKIDVKKGPAVLRQSDPRCEVDFEAGLFRKYKGNVDFSEKFPELETAIAHYSEQLRPLMPADVSQPISLHEAVHGYGRLEGLDLATSAGYPYCTMGISKKRLIENDCSELIKGMDLHGFNLPLVTCIKDELRPLQKVKEGNSRLIEASSVNDSVRMKMVCGRLFEAMIANPGTATGCAVGCDPDVDWTRFATELGDNVIAFDYKNFDASLSPGWFKALARVLKNLGVPAEELITNICHSTHIYGDKLYRVDGGMPSGTSGTSIFNSMINNLIIKTLVLLAYKDIDLDQLKILTYGDDCLFSYPFPLDPEHIAKMGSILGLQITPADKGAIFKPAGPITEVTFLKRGFKPDERYGFLYHPVFDVDEVYQSLAWTRDPRTLPEHVQSLCYLIWHCGRDVYDEFVRFVRSEPIGTTFYIPPFEVLEQRWLDKF
uniref:Genome polyprotein n=1 Tax=Avocet picornavirus B TaxID=2212790 RepID=A0A3G1RP78_9VIRU|nr:MAG: polyprotein [Avocet picornavirus B]